MQQNLLPFKYEIDPTKSKMTSLGGLPLFLDLTRNLGILSYLRKNLDLSDTMRGWSVSDIILSLLMVNLAGGDCVEDLHLCGDLHPLAILVMLPWRLCGRFASLGNLSNAIMEIVWKMIDGRSVSVKMDDLSQIVTLRIALRMNVFMGSA